MPEPYRVLFDTHNVTPCDSLDEARTVMAALVSDGECKRDDVEIQRFENGLSGEMYYRVETPDAKTITVDAQLFTSSQWEEMHAASDVMAELADESHYNAGAVEMTQAQLEEIRSDCLSKALRISKGELGGEMAAGEDLSWIADLRGAAEVISDLLADHKLDETMEYRCPACKRTDRLRVVVEVWADLIQYGKGEMGTDTNGDHEWGSNSTMECQECGEQGISEAFLVSEQSKGAKLHLCPKCGTSVAESKSYKAGGFHYCSGFCRKAWTGVLEDEESEEPSKTEVKHNAKA